LSRKKNRPHEARGGAAARAPAPAAARQAGPRPRGDAGSEVALIYGFHSVEAALRAPRRALIRLYATSAAAARLEAEIAARAVPVVIETA